MTYEFSVDELKTRIDKFLSKQLPEISRSRIQRGIERGEVTVNGKSIFEAKFVVRLKDAVVYTMSEAPDDDLKPTNTPLKVLYNHHDLLIIDKPEGLTVHPGAGFKGETLASALLYHFKDIKLVGEENRPGIVHRLDKDTSGVMLVAKTQEMYDHLRDAFKERKIRKEYIALVHGRLEKLHGFIETPIGKSQKDFRKMEVYPRGSVTGSLDMKKSGASDVPEAKEALTEYKVLEYLSSDTPPNIVPTFLRFESKQHSSAKKGAVVMKNGLENEPGGVDEYTLILVKLHTGRTHQIRVHFASLDHPLAGDELYGNGSHELVGLHRQFLHAKRIEVQLPDQTWIEAESELASDLKEVLTDLHSKVVRTL